MIRAHSVLFGARHSGAFEKDVSQGRVRAGVKHAQASGVHCGRPRVEVDLRPALAMLREGAAVRDVAAALKIDRSTLRRRLKESGLWPVVTSASGESAAVTTMG